MRRKRKGMYEDRQEVLPNKKSQTQQRVNKVQQEDQQYTNLFKPVKNQQGQLKNGMTNDKQDQQNPVMKNVIKTVGYLMLPILILLLLSFILNLRHQRQKEEHKISQKLIGNSLRDQKINLKGQQFNQVHKQAIQIKPNQLPDLPKVQTQDKKIEQAIVSDQNLNKQAKTSPNDALNKKNKIPENNKKQKSIEQKDNPKKQQQQVLNKGQQQQSQRLIYAPMTINAQQRKLAGSLKQTVLNRKFEEQDSKILFQKQWNNYNERYQIGSFNIQLAFCIVVPSYNNKPVDRYVYNLDSITNQNYSNYHIVYIDDASTDGTGQAVQQYKQNLSKLKVKDKFKIIHNSERKHAMENLVNAARNQCSPHQIFLVIDGDDFLLGKNVLKLYNALFQSGNGNQVWFIYSTYFTPKGLGYSRKINQSYNRKVQYRKVPFMFSHLRAFYTQLFLRINDNDLRDREGNYLKAANDVAICIPILQMSDKKVRYVDQITYYYNSDTGNNNHVIRKREQGANAVYIRSLKSYKPLEFLFLDKN